MAGKWIGMCLVGVGWAVEVAEADRSHDYINLDAANPYFERGERRWALSATHELRLSEDGATVTGISRAHGDAAARCAAPLLPLPPCETINTHEWTVWEPPPTKPSLASRFTDGIWQLSWETLLRALQQPWHSDDKKLRWHEHARAEQLDAWAVTLADLLSAFHIGLNALLEMQAANRQHCFFSWNAVVYNGTKTTPADTANIFIRHTAFARTGDISCPPFFQSFEDERGLTSDQLSALTRRLWDTNDQIAFLKQSRAYMQFFMATMKSVDDDLRDSPTGKALTTMLRLTEHVLDQLVQDKHTVTKQGGTLPFRYTDVLRKWYMNMWQVVQELPGSARVRQLTVPPTSALIPTMTVAEQIKHLTHSKWSPVYAGRVPTPILRLRDAQIEYFDTEFLQPLRLRRFKPITNGYHSIVAFVEVEEGADDPFEPAWASLTDMTNRRYTIKIPMPTVLTHMDDWLSNWLSEKKHIQNVWWRFSDPFLRQLMPMSYRLKPSFETTEYMHVEEFLDGTNMRQRLISLGEDVEMVKRTIYIVTRTLLEDFWSRGYCHGDLSLGNIILDGDERVKLIDIGLVERRPRGDFADDRYFENLRELYAARLLPYLPKPKGGDALREIRAFLRRLAAELGT